MEYHQAYLLTAVLVFLLPGGGGGATFVFVLGGGGGVLVPVFSVVFLESSSGTFPLMRYLFNTGSQTISYSGYFYSDTCCGFG